MHAFIACFADYTVLQEEVFKRREEGLKKKDLELQESLIRFSKFLQENDAKRMHALKKALDERKTREEKEREIEQLVSGYLVQLASSLLLRQCLLAICCTSMTCKSICKTSQSTRAIQQSPPFHAQVWKAHNQAKHHYINRLPPCCLQHRKQTATWLHTALGTSQT